MYVIGVDSCKMSIQQRLRLTEGSGCIHFPTTVGLPLFEQMTSEYLKTEYRRGRPERSWERRKGRAAEAWDCAVYALAAIHGLASHGIVLDVEADRLALLQQKGEPGPVTPYKIYRSRFVAGRYARRCPQSGATLEPRNSTRSGYFTCQKPAEATTGQSDETGSEQQ